MIEILIVEIIYNQSNDTCTGAKHDTTKFLKGLKVVRVCNICITYTRGGQKVRRSAMVFESN